MKEKAYYPLFFLAFLSHISLAHSRTREELISLYEQSSKPVRKKAAPQINRQPSEMGTCLFGIETHTHESSSLSWRAYHQGKIIHQSGGIFQFSTAKNITSLTIVIAMIQTPEQSTITSLSVPDGVDYLSLELEKIEAWNDPQSFTWSITSTRNTNGCVIPEDALIILLDPAYIGDIRVKKWEKKSDIILIPSIVLRDSRKLQEVSVKTVLAALDIDSFHSRSRIETTEAGNVHIQKIRES